MASAARVLAPLGGERRDLALDFIALMENVANLRRKRKLDLLRVAPSDEVPLVLGPRPTTRCLDAPQRLRDALEKHLRAYVERTLGEFVPDVVDDVIAVAVADAVFDALEKE